MFCANCGKPYEDGAAVCPECGAPAKMRSSYPKPEAVKEPMTKKAFWKSLGKKDRSAIKTAAILCYVSAGVTLLAGVLLLNPFVLIDVLLTVGLGLWLQLGQSIAAAVLLSIYAAYNVIGSLITNGRLGGMLILVASVFAIVGCVKFNKAYKAQLK